MSEALTADTGGGVLCPLPAGFQHLHSISEPEVLRATMLLLLKSLLEAA